MNKQKVKVWVLVDTNPYYYNCGHYPEYAVREREIDLNEIDPRYQYYQSREAAEIVASRKNHASSRDWQAFLNA
jgi:hypothetical protein